MLGGQGFIARFPFLIEKLRTIPGMLQVMEYLELDTKALVTYVGTVITVSPSQLLRICADDVSAEGFTFHNV